MSRVSSLRVPRFAEEAVQRARLSVVPRQDRAAGRVPFVILVGLVLLGGVLGLLMFNTNMQKTSFFISDLEAKAADLHQQAQQMRLELEKERDPQALAEWALSKNMVPPDSPAFLRLADGKVMGKVVPSTGVNSFRVESPAPGKPRVIDPKPIVVAPPAPVEVPAVETPAGQATTPAVEAQAGQTPTSGAPTP